MAEPTPLETTLLTDLIKEHSHHLKERSVSRTVEVLEAKRASFRREIQQLVRHLGLLIPITGNLSSHDVSQEMLLQEAAQRIGDDAFTQFLLQIMNEIE
ncbi:MAG: hypothetical protein AB4041_15815 [Microcystaceae cyanobacterium]